jgi:hypothetical protein
MIIDADVRIFYSYVECHYAGCCYSDCRGAARKECGSMLQKPVFLQKFTFCKILQSRRNFFGRQLKVTFNEKKLKKNMFFVSNLT